MLSSLVSKALCTRRLVVQFHQTSSTLASVFNQPNQLDFQSGLCRAVGKRYWNWSCPQLGFSGPAGSQLDLAHSSESACSFGLSLEALKPVLALLCPPRLLVASYIDRLALSLLNVSEKKHFAVGNTCLQLARSVQ